MPIQQIKTHWDDTVLFECELPDEIAKCTQYGYRLGFAVRKALESGVSLVGADLRRVSLIGEDLRCVNLRSADLSDSNLSGANLQRAELRAVNLSISDLSSANLDCAILSGANLRGVILSGASMRGAELYSADLFGSVLVDVILRGAELSRANLSGANLSRTDLSWCNLSEAKLNDTNLSGCNLGGANLSWCSLSGCDLRGVNLQFAILDRAKLDHIKQDMIAEVLRLPNELEALRDAIRDGRIDGSTYSGECACLAGTLAKARGEEGYQGENIVADAVTFRADSYSPRERWFTAIKPGDLPKINPAAALALEWVDEAIAIRDHIRRTAQHRDDGND